jgi:hypothetical protein
VGSMNDWNGKGEMISTQKKKVVYWTFVFKKNVHTFHSHGGSWLSLHDDFEQK